MIFYFILEYILVTTLMLVSFVLFKAIIRHPVSAQSLKIVLNASFIAFFISIFYTSIIVAIDHFYGNDKSSAIVLVLLMILNLSFYITFTVLYFIKKTSMPEE
ncbi:MAG TPA: hypothetical protein PK514_11365 [Spirochaetota bacterium]|nr:hypothetical protein [Spirochaetota bacterium]